MGPNVSCISDSGWPMNNTAQRADFALSQGIALQHVKSWVGRHSEPCASDVHDAVVVMGVLGMQQLQRQDKPSGWEKPVVALSQNSTSNKITSKRSSPSSSSDIQLDAQPATRPKQPRPE